MTIQHIRYVITKIITLKFHNQYETPFLCEHYNLFQCLGLKQQFYVTYYFAML